MNSSHAEPRRIQTGDVLAVLFEELCAQARTIRPWDADRRDGWLAACADVLSAVPDHTQRVCWAYYLASALARCRRGVPSLLTVQELLALAEGVQG